MIGVVELEKTIVNISAAMEHLGTLFALLALKKKSKA